MRLTVAIAAVVLLTLVVFAPVGGYDYVSYDDPAFVSEHPVVVQGLTASGIRWVLNPVNGYSTAGGPVTFLSHMLDVEVFGMRPGPHHLVNLGLHALNSALLLLVLWRMTGALGRSAAVAALFAVHPQHVESVAWIAERKDVLSTTFWLLTMWAYVGYVRRPGVARYVAVFVLLTLGLLSKAVVVTLPFVLLLLDAWPLARGPLTWADRRQWWPLVIEKLPLLVPVVATMCFVVSAQTKIGAVTAVNAIPWTLRLQSIVVSYATYLLKTVWPASLAVFYPFPHVIPAWKTTGSLGLLAALSLLAWRLAGRRPYVTIGWLWFIGTLIPMIGLVQVGSHSMADRFTYVPLIGVFLAVVWTASEWAAAGRWPVRVIAAIASGIVLVAAITARVQVDVWRDSGTLWRHAATTMSGNFRAYAGLAEAAAAKGDSTQAIAYYKEAVSLAPDAAEWHVNLGILQSGRGDDADAAASFRRALALRPDDAESHNNLAAMLVRMNRTREAIEHFHRALDLKPTYPLARRNLGLAYATTGDLDGGVREVLEALRVSPNEGQWHYEVAVLLLRLNRATEAVAHLQEAVRLVPNHPAARELMGQVSR